MFGRLLRLTPFTAAAAVGIGVVTGHYIFDEPLKAYFAKIEAAQKDAQQKKSDGQ